MATAPAPATPETPLVTIERDIVWIRGHILAVVITVAMIAGSIIGGIGLFENLIERHDARVAAAQQAKEGVDTATQAALVTQLQQMQSADAARDAAYQTTIQNLVKQMATEHAQTAQQIKTDATLDAQAAAARLVSQTKANPSDVTVNNDLVTMTLPLTRIVVTALDELPQAQSDINNLQAQLNAQQILTSDAKSELDKANQVISADKTELIQTIKADNAVCKDEVDKQAQKDRKRGFWFSVVAYIGGLATRTLL